jgi:hypothetical protein
MPVCLGRVPSDRQFRRAEASDARRAINGPCEIPSSLNSRFPGRPSQLALRPRLLAHLKNCTLGIVHDVRWLIVLSASSRRLSRGSLNLPPSLPISPISTSQIGRDRQHKPASGTTLLRAEAGDRDKGGREGVITLMLLGRAVRETDLHGSKHRRDGNECEQTEKAPRPGFRL